MRTIAWLVSMCFIVASLMNIRTVSACRLANTQLMWGSVPRTVDVYIQSGSGGNIGLSDTDFGAVVSRATSIWNEEGGTALKLRWAGTTSSRSLAGAIVIFGETNPSLVPGTGGCTPGTFPDKCCGGAYATTEIVPPGVTDPYFGGTGPKASVWMRSHITDQPNTCIPLQWRTDKERHELSFPQTDIVTILVHELGHAGFGLLHDSDCQLTFDPESIMTAYEYYDYGRIPRLYDKLEAQNNEGYRSSYSTIRRSYFGSSANAWGSWQILQNSHAWYRFSSLSNLEGFTTEYSYVEDNIHSYYGVIRELGWGGFGVYGSSQISDPYSGIQEPVGVTSAGVGAEKIIVYKSATSPSLFLDDSNRVCFRKSNDYGETWGAEDCPLNVFGSRRAGVTAGYDPASNAFVIAFARDNGQLRLVTYPANGSLTPVTITDLNQYSWHAPSIACSSQASSSNCRLVWENRDASGCLTWYEGSISPMTGTFVPTIGRQQCYPLFDTPSVTYTFTGDSFFLAFGQAASAAYVLKMPANATSWTGVPDLYNQVNSYISHPVMGAYIVCRFGCSGDVFGSLINYTQ